MLYKISIDCHWYYPKVTVTTEEHPGVFSKEQALKMVEKMAQDECKELNSCGDNSYCCKKDEGGYDMATLLSLSGGYQVLTGYSLVEVK